MKRILALLLTAILLMSAACAEGLKPRREAAEAPAAGSTPAQSALPGPAAPSGAGADDLLAAPEAEETSGLKPRRGEAEAAPAEPQPVSFAKSSLLASRFLRSVTRFTYFFAWKFSLSPSGSRPSQSSTIFP